MLKLLLFVFILVLSNIAYSISQIYLPDLLESEHFNFPVELIPLTLNSFLLVLLAIILYRNKIHRQGNTGHDFNKSSAIEKSTDSPSYTDQTLVKYFPNLLCIKDHDGRWIDANSEYLLALDLQFFDYVGKTDAFLALNLNSNNSFFQENIVQDKKAWELKKSIRKIVTITNINGEDFQLDTLTTPIFDNNNQPFRLILTGKPAKEIQKSEDERALLDSIFSTSHLSFIVLDEALRITSINRAFFSLFGYSLEEIKGQSLANLTCSIQKQEFCDQIHTYFQKNNYKLWSDEIECKNKNEQKLLIKLEIKPILSQNDSYENYFVTLEDITQFKEEEKRILQIAHYDHLTGLANRAMFMDRIAQFLSAATRHKLTAVIFFIDLDKFKDVNDTLGHDAGDEVLKQTASRLLKILRKEDVVARFSGDEFAILLLNEKTHEKAIFSATLIAEKIIKSLAQNYFVQRRELFVGSSVGISIFPEDGISAEQLLKHADMAMYEAKNAGRNNYQFYKKEFSEATQDRLALENDLRKAIKKGELQLFYQPQCDPSCEAITGAEVLIRWFYDPHGKNKLISPEIFVPIAEESGLIIDIGIWILEASCRQFKKWLEAGLSIPQISVNVSARQFMDPEFTQHVDSALVKADLDPKHLELEITESMLIGDLNKIELQLIRLKKMGIKIALDDFGTGYSSLSYLQKFPIDILKIDQSFIKELTMGSKEASIATAIIEMGHSLQQKIVAEGVENETQLMFLKNRNCDYIQGYYFSKPLPAFKMTTFLEEKQ